MSGTVTTANDAGRSAKLDEYEARTAAPLVCLALAYVVVFGIQVLWVSAPPAMKTGLRILDYLLWFTFVADFIWRIRLSERKWSYVAHHPLDVITILLPMLRPLRALRVFAAARVLMERGHQLAVGKVAMAIAVSALFVGTVAALTVLDVERNVEGATITTFGKAMWWAAVTMSTVGYGDTYPITGEGRMAAVLLMVVGVSLLGTITASFATWLTQRLQKAEDQADKQILLEVKQLREEIVQLRTNLAEASPPQES